MTLGEFTKTDMYQFGNIIYLKDESGHYLDWDDDDNLITEREVIAWKKDKLQGSISITIEDGKPDIVQYSIDVMDLEKDMENLIIEALTDAGVEVEGIAWKARWTYDGYHNSKPPIDSD